MLYVHWVLSQVRALAGANRQWMTWNLLLAVLPALMAVPLFRHRGNRGPGWWAAFAAFVLLLPNAPYVVTDLIHLPGDVQWVGSRGAVLVGVIPMYAVFVFVGLTAYAFALHEVDSWLDRIERPKWKVPAEVTAHVVCSVGVVLGRVARLNSWDTLTSPGATVSRTVETLSWSGTPLRFVLVLASTWVGFLVVRAVWRGARQVGVTALALR